MDPQAPQQPSPTNEPTGSEPTMPASAPAPDSGAMTTPPVDTSAPQPSASPSPTQSGKKSSKFVIIAIVVAVLLIGVIGAMVLL